MSALSLRKPTDETLEAPVLRVPVLPRVNLLPPEIEVARRFHQVKTGLGVAALATVGLVGLLYVSATSGVADAQAELDAETSTTAQLQTQAVAYRDVTAVYARAASAQEMLTQAMGTEVRWSRLLNDLSLTVPDNVWVKSATFTQTAPDASGAVTSAPGIGTATFTGTGFAHDDVAVWLEALAGTKGYADPYFSGATEALIGSRKVVTFTSTTTVTDEALSGRYTTTPGG